MASNQMGFRPALTSAAVSLAVCGAFGIGFFVGRDVGAANSVRPSEEHPGPDFDDSDLNPSTAESAHIAAESASGCAVSWEEPYVCVERAQVNGDYVEVSLRYVGFEPSIGSGMHAHVYVAGGGARAALADQTGPDNMAVEDNDPESRSTATMGAPGDASVGGGHWWVADSTSLKVAMVELFEASDGEQQRICAATATTRHTLLNLAESCVFLT